MSEARGSTHSLGSLGLEAWQGEPREGLPGVFPGVRRSSEVAQDRPAARILLEELQERSMGCPN